MEKTPNNPKMGNGLVLGLEISLGINGLTRVGRFPNGKHSNQKNIYCDTKKITLI